MAYFEYMQKRSSIKDENQLAKSLVDEIILETEGIPDMIDRPKNPAAVMLGRLGGKVGGRVRAERLSGERKSEIARKAAQARWAKSASKE